MVKDLSKMWQVTKFIGEGTMTNVWSTKVKCFLRYVGPKLHNLSIDMKTISSTSMEDDVFHASYMYKID